ncbi:hypothetical protein DRP05_14355 [Archaeoglobales archaeon]|nr:MAG: hypothetical protein DRP05_14355 [Archaeoglobales archaeon]
MSPASRTKRDEAIRMKRFDELDMDISPEDLTRTQREIFEELKAIVYYQFSAKKKGLRGFILHGPPGTGKTTIVKLLAKEVGAHLSSPLYLIFVDGSDIARPRYGDSEERLNKIFNEASKDTGHYLVLFDDIESLVLSRESSISKDWHYSLNAIFFHRVDELDTTRSIVFCTTNKYGLVDDAIRDRFYEIELGKPTKEEMKKIAKLLFEKRYQIEEDFPKEIVFKLIDQGKCETIRDVENLVIKEYINAVRAKYGMMSKKKKENKRVSAIFK